MSFGEGWFQQSLDCCCTLANDPKSRTAGPSGQPTVSVAPRRKRKSARTKTSRTSRHRSSSTCNCSDCYETKDQQLGDPIDDLVNIARFRSLTVFDSAVVDPTLAASRAGVAIGTLATPLCRAISTQAGVDANRRGYSAVPDARIAGRVLRADVGRVCGDALVVEEQLGPVAPVGRHLLVVDVGRGVLGVMPAAGVVPPEEPVDPVAGGVLDVDRPVVVVDHVALVVDRLDVAGRGHVLVDGAR